MKNNAAIVQAFKEMAPEYENKVDQEILRFWGRSYDEFINILLDRVDIQEGNVLLDVATGTLAIPLRLIERKLPVREIVGLDITPAMLLAGKQMIITAPGHSVIRLACGSAVCMPFQAARFDVATCALATHHMAIAVVLRELFRIMRPGGHLVIADVGASPVWKYPLIKPLLQICAFIYFLPTEGPARAQAEASAVTNIRTAGEWQAELEKAGFEGVIVEKLSNRRRFTPAPLIMRAAKPASDAFSRREDAYRDRASPPG